MADENIYYHPEKYGLMVIDELDPGESYEFNTFVAWKHEDGRVFYAQDSGCSCPTPFEDFFMRSLDDTNLTEITKENFETKFRIEFDAYCKYYGGKLRYDPDRIDQFITKVKD